MFIKHGDGKILSVVETDELTEDQKKSAKSLSEQTVKQSQEAETTNKKVSGSN
jgi:hypothetical protein